MERERNKPLLRNRFLSSKAIVFGEDSVRRNGILRVKSVDGIRVRKRRAKVIEDRQSEKGIEYIG